MIKIEELKEGKAYIGHGRNFDVAIWDGRVFHGLRYKFHEHFMSEEWSSEDSGTFTPERELV